MQIDEAAFAGAQRQGIDDQAGLPPRLDDEQPADFANHGNLLLGIARSNERASRATPPLYPVNASCGVRCPDTPCAIPYPARRAVGTALSLGHLRFHAGLP